MGRGNRRNRRCKLNVMTKMFSFNGPPLKLPEHVHECNFLATVAATEDTKSTSTILVRGTEDSSHERDLCPRT